MRTVICPIVLCGGESWSLTINKELGLRFLEDCGTEEDISA
jgi:hypothetical protein